MSARYQLDLATPADDPALRALFRENPMGTTMRVAFEREPDFFHAAQVQGEFVQVGVAREGVRVVGVGTRAVSAAFVNGAPQSLGYLGDLRAAAHVRGGTLVARGYRLLRAWHADARTRLYTTVIFADNTTALRTIAAGRAGLPTYRDCGELLCPGVNLRGRLPDIACGCEIARGDSAALPEIIECLHRSNRRRHFAPVHRAEFFAPGGRWRDFRVEDFYVARRAGRIVGVLGRWDQRGFKQTRVTGYGGALHWLRPLANAAAPLFGTPRLPRPGAKLPFFHACFAAVDDDNPDVFRALLRRLYNDATGSQFAWFIIGFHARDPLAAALRDYTLTPFRARLFCVVFPEDEPAFRELDDRLPHLEPALL